MLLPMILVLSQQIDLCPVYVNKKTGYQMYVGYMVGLLMWTVGIHGCLKNIFWIICGFQTVNNGKQLGWLQGSLKIILKIKNKLKYKYVHAMLSTFQDLDSCIGCMQTTADIKLRKQCDSSGEGACGECYCRPMWCLECMGKWFASRQLHARREPETWMASKAHCPTCRANFCMLDVCKLESNVFI